MSIADVWLAGRGFYSDRTSFLIFQRKKSRQNAAKQTKRLFAGYPQGRGGMFYRRKLRKLSRAGEGN
jgi:hypothetical protein